jgi:hypothetical protein
VGAKDGPAIIVAVTCWPAASSTITRWVDCPACTSRRTATGSSGSAPAGTVTDHQSASACPALTSVALAPSAIEVGACRSSGASNPVHTRALSDEDPTTPVRPATAATRTRTRRSRGTLRSSRARERPSALKTVVGQVRPPSRLSCTRYLATP